MTEFIDEYIEYEAECNAKLMKRYKRKCEGVVPFLNQSITIDVYDLERSDESILEELQSILEANAQLLYSETIALAKKYTLITFNSFYERCRPDEDPEEEDRFMDLWNSGDDSYFIGTLEYWYNNEQANNVAKLIRSKYSHVDTFEEMHLFVSQAILELKYTHNNFGNIILAIDESLKSNPELILDYVRVKDVSVRIYEEDIQWILKFDCDWNTREGFKWLFLDGTYYTIGQY